jgi:MFS family permease
MYSEAEIESAVAAGAITPDAASRLRDHISRERAGLPADEEHFRLLTGFNDIFVALAAVILLVAVGWLAQQIPPRIEDVGPSPFAGFFVAATAWGLAEFFTRKRRMALPSIILLLAFVGGIFATVGISGALLVMEIVGPNVGDQVGDAMARTLASAVLIASGAAAAAAAWIHWRRFKCRSPSPPAPPPSRLWSWASSRSRSATRRGSATSSSPSCCCSAFASSPSPCGGTPRT